MATIIGVALPFFALLVCGMLAVRWRWIDDAGLIGLNAFVFYLALPAVLFQKVVAAPLERLLDWRLYVAYEGSCLIAYGLTLLLARRLLRRSLAEAAICAFAVGWGNVGYMGVPLLIAAFGESRALPAVLAMVLDVVVLQSITVVLIERDTGRGRGGLRSLATAIARNPLIVAVLAGVPLAALDLPLPAPLVGFLAILAPAASPSALVALGGTLRPQALGQDLGLAALLTAMKLVGLPVIAWLVLRLVPVPPDLVAPILVTTALPTAASVYVVAQRYQVMEQLAASVVFLSHLAGIATLTLILVLVAV